jgi:hydrogenase/urease accessory protein HupE
MIKQIFIFLALLFMTNISAADEIRPGYLELNEETPGTFSVLWKVPQIKNQRPVIEAHFPTGCSNKSEIISQVINNAILKRWYIQCTDSIHGQRISIEDPGNSNTEVLLRLKWLDGEESTALVRPSAPFYSIPEKSSITDIVTTYLLLGTEHILLGVDHLLFVFALLLIVSSTRRLVITITAFTIAHSITLGAATLGYVHVPQQPVEAIIALSILFLAVEIVHGKQGRPGYAARWPWLVAFIFGLLHGFGFAGALSEIGLPQQSIPLALVFFNIGVELGQLFFVLAVVVVSWLLHHLKQEKLLNRAETAVTYSIGGISSFWLFERVSLF